MSPRRLPRWTTLLVLPLLVGAFLLMHGLDARVGTTGVAEAAAPAPGHVEQNGQSANHGAEHCGGCAVGHVMAACVAIIATVVGVRLARRRLGTLLTTLVDGTNDWAPATRVVLRPPESAWVHLTVMRC